jgi:hypothetical protein
MKVRRKGVASAATGYGAMHIIEIARAGIKARYSAMKSPSIKAQVERIAASEPSEGSPDFRVGGGGQEGYKDYILQTRGSHSSEPGNKDLRERLFWMNHVRED